VNEQKCSEGGISCCLDNQQHYSLPHSIQHCHTILSMQGKLSVLVVGDSASGFLGRAVVSEIVARYSKEIDISVAHYGISIPLPLPPTDGYRIIHADLSDTGVDSLVDTLKDFDRIFIVTPGVLEKEQLVCNILNAAKQCNRIKFVAISSMLMAGSDTIFGKQFEHVEQHVKNSGLEYSILQLPPFIDNLWLYSAPIKVDRVFYDPRLPDKPHTPICVQDVGKAAAEILFDCCKHRNTVYKLVAPPCTLNEVAEAFTKVVGKTVSCVNVPYKATKESLLGSGFQEWQADAVLEMYKMIDHGHPQACIEDTSDFIRITGELPVTMPEWVEMYSAGFVTKKKSSRWHDSLSSKEKTSSRRTSLANKSKDSDSLVSTSTRDSHNSKGSSSSRRSKESSTSRRSKDSSSTRKSKEKSSSRKSKEKRVGADGKERHISAHQNSANNDLQIEGISKVVIA
jgi:uncharacterized protein YbjT (DUF2867 family)